MNVSAFRSYGIRYSTTRVGYRYQIRFIIILLIVRLLLRTAAFAHKPWQTGSGGANALRMCCCAAVAHCAAVAAAVVVTPWVPGI